MTGLRVGSPKAILAPRKAWIRPGPTAMAALFVAGTVTAGPSDLERPGSFDPVAVRYAEGTVHGFLDLRTDAGALLPHGDLLQLVKDGVIESRMIFHFSESVFEETVTFTQRDVFAMQSYHLVQSGPAFEEDLEVTLEGSGAYVVKTRSHDDGEEEEHTGTLELPPDVYNGMVITIAKNLPEGVGATVHIVAFTPEPRIIELELAPADTTQVLFGTQEAAALHIVLKPRLGALLRFFATVTGQAPPDSHVWLVTEEIPAFVRYEGPLYSGPVWRIDLTSPVWPRVGATGGP